MRQWRATGHPTAGRRTKRGICRDYRRSPRRWPRVERHAGQLSAAGLRRRGARAEGRPGRGRGGQGVPAPGRRLRRKLRRVPPQQHPRHLPRAAADGGGADLRQQAAGGEGRPHGRPVRQAALARRPRRSDGVELPSYLGDNINGIEFDAGEPRARSRSAWSAPTASPPRRSTCCAPSPAAAMPICARSTAGRSTSWAAAPGPRSSPRLADRIGEALDFMAGLRGRSARPCRSCRAPASTPATRRCCCPTSRR